MSCWLPLLAGLFAVSSGAATPPPALVLDHVTVVDVTGGPSRSNQTVVIAGETITALGPAGEVAVPAGSRRVSAAGKYLIPGLWDFHTHHELSGEVSLPLYVAHGVTGTRDMGSGLELILGLRQKVASGVVVGPRIVAPGPILDNQPSYPLRWVVRNAEDARAAVQRVKAAGLEFVKVHNSLPREAYFAAVAAAAQVGLPVAGHVPLAVTLDEAITARHRSIEHLSEFRVIYECARGPAIPGVDLKSLYDPAKCDALFARFRDAGVWHTPTLGMLQRVPRLGLPGLLEADPHTRYMVPSLRRFWLDAGQGLAGLTPPQRQMLDQLAALARTAVGGMHHAGVRLLAGSDAFTPGFSLHDELAELVQAGLSPLAALQTATLHPAEFLGLRHLLGTVAAGQQADLVLLDADPLADIQNVRRVHAVVLRGRLLERAELDGFLAGVEKVAGGR